MYKTEKRYWSNGFERRGSFWTYTLSLGNIGLMICRPFYNNPMFNFYKLV